MILFIIKRVASRSIHILFIMLSKGVDESVVSDHSNENWSAVLSCRIEQGLTFDHSNKVNNTLTRACLSFDFHFCKIFISLPYFPIFGIDRVRSDSKKYFGGALNPLAMFTRRSSRGQGRELVDWRHNFKNIEKKISNKYHIRVSFFQPRKPISFWQL